VGKMSGDKVHLGNKIYLTLNLKLSDPLLHEIGVLQNKCKFNGCFYWSATSKPRICEYYVCQSNAQGVYKKTILHESMLKHYQDIAVPTKICKTNEHE
jgi:hypothetical protein